MSISVGGRNVRRIPPASEHAHRQRRDGGGVAFIQMKAAALDEHRDSLERPGDELPLVPRGAGLREAGDIRVRDADRVADLLRHVAQPGAEHDRDLGLDRADPARDRVGRRTDETAPCSRLPAFHSRIPASVADRKFASVPASIARKPSRARSCFRSGTSAPMPPI